MEWKKLIDALRSHTLKAVYGNGVLVVPAGITQQLPRCATKLHADYHMLRTRRGDYEVLVSESARAVWQHVVTGESCVDWKSSGKLRPYWTIRETTCGHLVAVKPGRRAFVLNVTPNRIANARGGWAEVVDPKHGLYCVWIGVW